MGSIHALRILHHLKGTDHPDPSRYRPQSWQFYLNTCQREIWILDPLDPSPVAAQGDHWSVHHGSHAYQLLLQVATGLESEVQGETDIFGQVKEAWKTQGLDSSLQKVFHSLFEDTKDIRSRYLRGVGGSSYGTLVRRLLDLQDPKQSPKQGKEKAPILIVGAGKIAQAVAPFLTENELWIWNRTEKRLLELENLLRQNHGVQRLRLFRGAESERSAWEKAGHILLCIPLDPKRDPDRISEFAKAGPSSRKIVHLGAHQNDCQNDCRDWNLVKNFYTLDDLFQLQKSQNRMRSIQVERAKRACHERALLRSLGGSITLPHGWEDLSAFA